MNYNRPSLDKEQINTFKSDIKLLSSLIIKEINAHKAAKYPITSTQNKIARFLNFSSFSELALNSNAHSSCTDFSLENAFSSSQLLEIYSQLHHSDKYAEKLNIEHIDNALVEFRKIKHSPKEPVIDILLLHEIINESSLKEHHYTYECGYPDDFKIEKESEFFDGLNHGNHFLVKKGREYRCYTLFESEHIYTKQIFFNATVGRWLETSSGAICVGNK